MAVDAKTLLDFRAMGRADGGEGRGEGGRKGRGRELQSLHGGRASGGGGFHEVRDGYLAARQRRVPTRVPGHADRAQVPACEAAAAFSCYTHAVPAACRLHLVPCCLQEMDGLCLQEMAFACKRSRLPARDGLCLQAKPFSCTREEAQERCFACKRSAFCLQKRRLAGLPAPPTQPGWAPAPGHAAATAAGRGPPDRPRWPHSASLSVMERRCRPRPRPASVVRRR